MRWLQPYTREFSRNLQLAFPVMLAQLGHVLVGLADNLMVGRLGAAELAAISLGNSLFFLAMSLGIGFSFSLTPLIAESDGQKDIKSGRSIFLHGLVLCGIMGTILCTCLLLAEPMLYYLDQPPEVVELALPYFRIVALSIIPVMLFQSFRQFADGLSQTRYSMYAILIANGLNILLNYLFIYGAWGFPRMEVEGAAVGTLISRCFMVALIFAILRYRKKFEPYFSRISKVELHKRIFTRILKLGLPTALQMFFEVSLFASAIFLAGTLGVHEQAANQIALNLIFLTYMVAVGLSITSIIRVGNHKGRGDFEGLRRVARSIFILTFLVETVFALGFIFLKDVLPTLYIDDVQVISIAATLLVIAALFQLSDGLQVVFLGSLRGLQDVNIPTAVCFVAYWLVGFPTCYFLGKPEAMGATGIWIGLLAGLTVSALLLYFRFHVLSNRLIIRNKT